jgi:Protein of unknown function (DUF2840)
MADQFFRPPKAHRASTSLGTPAVASDAAEATDDELTYVELTWIEKRIENWMRFGHGANKRVTDPQRRVVLFVADSIFAFVRWTANDYGTLISRVDILRAVGPGERYSTVPFVRPGGESLLRISGWPKLEKVLQAIDIVEALGIDPADAAPEHWRHVHNRLSVGERPQPYSLIPLLHQSELTI